MKLELVSKIGLCAMAFGLLSGCMSTIQTQVESFSAIPEDAEPKTVYLAPFEAKDARSLEWRRVAGVLSASLTSKGYTVVPRKAEAKYTAFFGFAIDDGKRVQSQYSIPQWGVTGYSGANTYGTYGAGYYSANTTLMPTYGVTGYTTGTKAETIYTRAFGIDIADNKSKKMVYEGRAVSAGACHSFAAVSKQIIESTLENFPKGKTGTVSKPFDGSC